MEREHQELVDLIAHCALRDQAALQKLFERTSGYLNAIAFRMLRSDELANEVLQEAYLQVWQNAASYRPHLSKPMTWLMSIVRYRALDRLDKEKRYNSRYESTDEEDSYSNDDLQTRPESKLQNDQLGGQIHECLDGLNEKFRKCVYLAYIEGYSRDEIAESLSANTNTIKSWLRRGSEKLKQCLQAKQIQTTQAH